MNKELSNTISYLRFPIILLVVILHCYTTTRGIINSENNVLYTHISYIFSLTFGEMGVPLFFTISGYLFFINYTFTFKCYINKLKTRFKTLVIPYFIWNTLFLLFYWIFQNIESFQLFFNSNNLLINEYSTINVIRAYWDSSNWDSGNGVPILQPYWYIRNLIILCIISPIIAILLKYFKWIVVLIPLLLWISSLNLVLPYSSLTFFSLGSLLAIYNIDIINIIKKYKSFVYISFGILLIFIYIIHFYYYNDNEPYLHRIIIFWGIPFLFCIAYDFKNKISIKEIYTQSSFIIYTLHLPIMLAIRKIQYKAFPQQTEYGNLIFYFTAIILTLWICIIIYKLLNQYFYRFLKLSTGR